MKKNVVIKSVTFLAWISASLLLSPVKAQQLTFQKIVGGANFEYAYAMQKTLDGGYVVGASSSSFGATAIDFWVIKYDANGNMLWNKICDNTDNGGTRNEPINDIFQTSDSGYIAGGFTDNVNPPKESDAYVIRMDKNGDTLWTRYWGGTTVAGSLSDIYLVTQAGDGNVLVGGYTTVYGDGMEDAFVLKLDINTGDTLWTRVWGGPQNEWLYHMQTTTDGGIILSGLTSSFGAGGYDVLLIKTDANGNIQWSKAYGDAQNQFGFGHCLQQTTDGGYAITGSGGFLLKTDANGTVQWQKFIQFDSAFSGHALEQTTDGGYIIGGTVGTTLATDRACLVKANDTGKVIWSYFYGGNKGDIGYTARQASDGGYLMTGQTSSFGTESLLNPDAYIVKTDSNGISGCNQTPAGAVSATSDYITTNAPMIVNYGPQTKHPHVSIKTGYSDSLLCETLAGVNEIKKTNNLIAYPNPSNGKFMININGSNGKVYVKIYTMVGEEIYNETLNPSIENDFSIDAIALPTGIYLLKIQTEDGASTVKKVEIIK